MALNHGLLLFFLFNGFLGTAKDLTDSEKKQQIEGFTKEYAGKFVAPEVSPSTLKQWRQEKKDLVIVDARSEKEWSVSRIEGAITQIDFEKNFSRFRDQHVVAYCTVGYRSAQYAESLRRKGVKAWNLHGSILAWVHEEGALVDATGQKTNRVHVYGKKWDLLPKGYQSVVN